MKFSPSPRSALFILVLPFLFFCGCSQQAVSESDSAPRKTSLVSSNKECCEVADRHTLVSAQVKAVKSAPFGDWPMFGGTPARNMANLVDTNIPDDWSVEGSDRKNIKWMAELGSKCYGGPVIAGGKVFVGTNNANPRDPKIKGTKFVVMCFQEADGKFLWQAVHESSQNPIFKDIVNGNLGLLSTPAVSGNRLYYLLPQAEVICADVDTGKPVWRLDMLKELKVFPFHCSNCSPMVVGNLLLLLTGNGINEESGKVVNPDAPSFLALDKDTGKIIWQSNLPGDRIIEGQWSNPALARVNGIDQVIVPGGDAYLYGLELATGKLIWKFNCQPQRPVPPDDKVANYMIASPVVQDGKVYIGLGVYPGGHPKAQRSSHFLCVDITKVGDVSPKSLDAKASENKDSALVWSYGGEIVPRPKKGRPVLFGSTISTCAIHDGLVFVSEENGYMYCLDAGTGQKYGEYDFKSGVWGSPLYVAGKVYIGTEDGEIVVFQAGKDLKVIRKIDMGELIHSTPAAANGTLYVMTTSKLYAIAGKK